MRKPLVTIIVPCYKVEQYLPVCIESILNQTYANWELILVDDGSPDRCGAICDQYAAENNRIRVIHKANGGLSSARNAGLDIMHGEYVSFLDSDDFWHKDYLRIMLALCIDNNAQMSQCKFVRGEETVFPQNNGKAQVSVYTNHTVFTSFAANIIMCGKMYARHLFDDIRMPIGLINEDDWTTWKLYYKSDNVAVTSLALYYYTVNPASIMGQSKKKPNFSYLDAYKERINFFINTKEEDLEHCSRMQLCKSMVLSYSNPQLTKDERLMVKSRFDESYAVIASSKYIPTTFKALFYLFHHFPMLASKMAQKLG